MTFSAENRVENCNCSYLGLVRSFERSFLHVNQHPKRWCNRRFTKSKTAVKASFSLET